MGGFFVETFVVHHDGGLTLEQLDEYARQRTNRARRECYARHPERVMRQRLTSATNLLNRHGLIDDLQRDSILAAVKGVNA